MDVVRAYAPGLSAWRASTLRRLLGSTASSMRRALMTSAGATNIRASALMASAFHVHTPEQRAIGWCEVLKCRV